MKEELRKGMEYTGRLFLIMAGMIAVLFLLLILVWCIPDKCVIGKQQESLMLFDRGGYT